MGGSELYCRRKAPVMPNFRRSVPALIVAGMVVVSGTSGAVAAGMITGANIKDNTVTTADIKDLTLRASDTSTQFDNYMRRVAGYRAIHQTAVVAPSEQGFLIALCPGETRLLGSQAFWRDSAAPVQVEVLAEGDYTKAVRSYAVNDRIDADLLHLIAFCGRTAAG